MNFYWIGSVCVYTFEHKDTTYTRTDTPRLFITRFWGVYRLGGPV